MRRVLVLGLVVAMSGVALPAHARNYGVSARDSFFQKAFVVVRVGDTVTWRNAGELEHTVTSFPDAPKQFSSSDSRECVPNANPPIIGNDPDDCMDPGDTFVARFTRPGTYDYFCKVHGNTAQRPDNDRSANDQACGMCGRIVVKTASTPPPTAGPSKAETARPTATASVSPSPSETSSPSPSPSASDEPDGGSVASRDEGGGLGRGAIALLGIMALSGAGWWTWRRYLAGT